MPDLKDGETAYVKGSARLPYQIKNVGGVYSCSCPAWRNQSLPIERRSCKHIRSYRGEAAEAERLGQFAATESANQSANAKIAKKKAPALLLAETWNESIDPTGWLISEKLDGARAWWDGSRFISRGGNPFHAPA